MTQEGAANGFLGVGTNGVTTTGAAYDANATDEAERARWLQRAIWYFEVEGAAYQFGSDGTTNNYYVQLALDNATGFGLGSVRVLNLVSPSNEARQDQLVLLENPPPITIVPDGQPGAARRGARRHGVPAAPTRDDRLRHRVAREGRQVAHA